MSADDSPPAPRSHQALISSREARVVALVTGALALVYLAFGQLNWTVSGGASLQPATQVIVAIAQIPETDIALVTAGQPARIRLRAYPGTDVPGRVQSVGDTAIRDGEGATSRVSVPVTISLAAPGGVQLRPGFTGRAVIVVARDRAALVLWGRLSRFVLSR